MRRGVRAVRNGAAKPDGAALAAGGVAREGAPAHQQVDVLPVDGAAGDGGILLEGAIGEGDGQAVVDIEAAALAAGVEGRVAAEHAIGNEGADGTVGGEFHEDAGAAVVGVVILKAAVANGHVLVAGDVESGAILPVGDVGLRVALGDGEAVEDGLIGTDDDVGAVVGGIVGHADIATRMVGLARGSGVPPPLGNPPRSCMPYFKEKPDGAIEAGGGFVGAGGDEDGVVADGDREGGGQIERVFPGVTGIGARGIGIDEVCGGGSARGDGQGDERCGAHRLNGTSVHEPPLCA